MPVFLCWNHFCSLCFLCQLSLQFLDVFGSKQSEPYAIPGSLSLGCRSSTTSACLLQLLEAHFVTAPSPRFGLCSTSAVSPLFWPICWLSPSILGLSARTGSACLSNSALSSASWDLQWRPSALTDSHLDPDYEYIKWRHSHPSSMHNFSILWAIEFQDYTWTYNVKTSASHKQA